MTREIVPELQNGDRLTRAEFHRRYSAMPGVVKAELIEGVVYMPSPVSHRRHSEPHSRIMGWLVYYRTKTEGTETGDNGTVILDDRNEPQPDAFLRILPECGGQSRTSEFVEGAPELVIEIAASSVSYDLHDKRAAYLRNQVNEYVVWRVGDGEVDWFVRREGRYARLEPDADGVIRSERFPGLWLDVRALLECDLVAVLAAIDEGCVQPEHHDFVAELAQRRG